MTAPKVIAFFILFGVWIPSCTYVLSEHSDREVWHDYQKKSEPSRVPASTSPMAMLQGDLSQIPFRDLLLSCGKYDSPASCYQDALVRQFDEVFRRVQKEKPALNAKIYRARQSEFLIQHSYERTLEEVMRFHQGLLSGVELGAREHARDLFKECDSEKARPGMIERFDLFTGGTTEVPKGLYACLVRHWEEDLAQLLKETTDRLGLKLETPGVTPWIIRYQLAPIYESELSSIFERQAQSEREQFEKSRSEWLKDLDPSLSEEECIRRFTPVLREKFPFSPVEQWISDYRKSKRQ